MAHPSWTKERITAAFKRFFDENGRFPTVDDCDFCDYLPTARTLQRRFNGVLGMRSLLGLEITDYRIGDVRSNSAKQIGTRGLLYEQKIQKILVERFGEMFVHGQKPFNDRSRLDFFVYGHNYSFGVDVFYPTSFGDNIRNLIKCVNIKEKSYVEGISFDVIFLQMNPEIKQTQIDSYLARRKSPLNPRIKILSEPEFLEFISKIEPLRLAN